MTVADEPDSNPLLSHGTITSYDGTIDSTRKSSAHHFYRGGTIVAQLVTLDYGDGFMEVELPDSATVVRYGTTCTDPPEVDPWEATRQTLEHPLGMPPLRELAAPGRTAVIAFPDRVKGGSDEKSHRRVCIPLIVNELLKGGMRKENIMLLCAPGLHRKNHEKDMYEYLGKEIMDEFYPDRIVPHDAEAPDLLDLGKDEMGNTVQCNRLVAECDIPILIGHVQGNPYGGYSGSYKMAVTGITGWKSIASHHTPSTMHRDDLLPASINSTMRKQFDSIGRAMEKGILSTINFFRKQAGIPEIINK